MKTWKDKLSNFVVEPINCGQQNYDYKLDSSLKEKFGIALAQGYKNPFEAACAVFGKETNKALFVSVNWINDPIVIEAKKTCNGVLKPLTKLLDKEEVSRKLLEFSEEQIIFNGETRYCAEAKDRLAAYKLYCDIQGFISKDTINNTINNQPKFMEIKFVEPDKKEIVKTIEHETTAEDILESSPIKLKLVG